jgi:hypothetical protein
MLEKNLLLLGGFIAAIYLMSRSQSANASSILPGANYFPLIPQNCPPGYHMQQNFVGILECMPDGGFS